MEHTPPPGGWENWTLWGFVGAVLGMVTTAFRHKHAKVDTEVLKAAHAENVGLLSEILRAQNDQGARTEKKIDELRSYTEASVGEIKKRLGQVEQRLGIGT